MKVMKVGSNQYSAQYTNQNNLGKSNVSFGLRAEYIILEDIKHLETTAEKALNKEGEESNAIRALKEIGIIKTHLEDRTTDDIILCSRETKRGKGKVREFALALNIANEQLPWSLHALQFPGTTWDFRESHQPLIDALKDFTNLRKTLENRVQRLVNN